MLYVIKKSDLVKFVMFTLVSRDFVPVCKYVKRYVYPENQGTQQLKKAMQNEKKITLVKGVYDKANYKEALLPKIQKELLIIYI